MNPDPKEEGTDPVRQGQRLLLIDASGFIFRAFYSLPDMNAPDGTPTNAVYGFCTMLQKVVTQWQPTATGVVFDTKGPTFRNDIFPAYKGHRPDPPEEIKVQFPIVREAAEAYNFRVIESAGFEADDLIASYAKHAQGVFDEVVIVSADKDLMQLVTGAVYMYDPSKEKRIGLAEVEEKFGVPPHQVIDVQALAGDSADNVPGVPGIGMKTAAALIHEFGTLEAVLENAHTIKQNKRREMLITHAETARISKQLVTLADDVALPFAFAELHHAPPDAEKLRAFLEHYGMRQLLTRHAELLIGSTPSTQPVRSNMANKTEPAPVAALQQLAIVTEVIEFAANAPPLQELPAHAAALVLTDFALPDSLMATTPTEVVFVFPHAVATSEGMVRALGCPLASPLAQQLLCQRGIHMVTADVRTLLQAQAGIGKAPSETLLAHIDDVEALSFVGGAGSRSSHDLAKLAEVFELLSIEDLAATTESLAKPKGRNPSPPDPQKVRCAVATMAQVALALHPHLLGIVHRDRIHVPYFSLDKPLISVLHRMESIGIALDSDHLIRLGQNFAERISTLTGSIHGAAGREFAIGSPKQLGEVLFHELQLEAGGKTKKGKQLSTSVDVLTALADDGHAIAAQVLQWRHLSKLKSTYIDALLAARDGRGRVHTTYQTTAAQTGRLSAINPNLQNIPVRTEDGRLIREGFIADNDSGRTVMLSLDYSQIELRLFAHIAGIPPMLEAFAAGEDIHLATAREIFGRAITDASPADYRRRAKAINFGIIYGISSFGLKRQLGCSMEEARGYMGAYFHRFPGIKTYMETITEQLKQRAYVTTLSGRRIHLPGIRSDKAMVREHAKRQAINAPMQGSAADLIKRAMVLLPESVRDALHCRLLLQVHDELVFEVAESHVDEVIEQVRNCMIAAGASWKLAVPLVVDAGMGSTWGAAH